jgi:hypothetical protein
MENDMQEIYLALGRISQSSAPNSGALVNSYIDNIMKSSRMLCSSCIPFLLITQRHNNAPKNIFQHFAMISASEKDETWLLNMQEAFLDHFLKYVSSLGFQHVVREGTTKKYPAYAQKFHRGGLLLVELGFNKPLLSCKLFSFHGISTRTTSLATSIGLLKHNKQLKMIPPEDCWKYKQLLNINGLLFDFHLSQLYHFLVNDRPSLPPYEFVKLLQNILTFYSASPTGAKGAILWDKIRIERKEGVGTPYEIFSYIASNAARYNMGSLHRYGIIPGLFATSHTSKKLLAADSFQYGTILFMEPNKSAPFDLLIHFVLWSTTNKPLTSFSPSEADTDRLVGAARLKEIASKLKKELDKSIIEATKHYHRDLLWKQLQSSSIQDHSSKLNTMQFKTLKELCHCKTAQELDGKLTSLLSMNLNWVQLFNHLASVYSKSVTSLLGMQEPHLIIFGSTGFDMFFNLFVENNKLNMMICLREWDNEGEGDMLRQLSNLINQMMYFFWKSRLLDVK